MALNPDFVIMTSGTGGRGGDSSQVDLRDALVGAGIPVAYFEVTTFDDYERLMRTFTDITGRADLYDQDVAKVAAAIDAVVGAVPAEHLLDGAVCSPPSPAAPACRAPAPRPGPCWPTSA